jgi:hypothetical protein
MNFNPAIQVAGLVAWDGAAATPRDVSTYNNFGFTFEVTADITTDAVFTFQSAPASAANPCVPGSFSDVNAVVICLQPWAVPVGTLASVMIPAGTKAGQVCRGTLPCKPDKFLQMKAVSGDTAKVHAVMLLQGPH